MFCVIGDGSLGEIPWLSCAVPRIQLQLGKRGRWSHLRSNLTTVSCQTKILYFIDPPLLARRCGFLTFIVIFGMLNFILFTFTRTGKFLPCFKDHLASRTLISSTHDTIRSVVEE